MSLPDLLLTLVAVYVARLNQTDLLDLGLGSDHRVDIVCNASTPHETRLSPTLSDLSEGCFSDRITNPAVILVTVPKDARPHAALPLVRVGAVA